MTVLDASAVLAWIAGEPGGEEVAGLLDQGVVSAVNWSEIWQKLDARGADAHRALHRLVVLGVRVEPLTSPDAVRAAELWPRTRACGLSLADRCCLALAERLGLPAVTADRSWAGLDLPVPVQVIR